MRMLRLLLVPATLALTFPFAVNADAQQTKVTIGKVIGGDGFHVPTYVALDQGFFKAEGLDGNLLELDPRSQVTGVISGNLDCAPIPSGGAQAALIDPSKATLLWRKRFALRGGHPAVAITQEGQAEVVFYEAGRVRVAAISRDGVGTTSTFAKVAGDEPRPWIAPGRVRGEWLVAWLDTESGHTESFVARQQCRN